MKHWPIFVIAIILAGAAGYLSYLFQDKSTAPALPGSVQIQHDIGGDFNLVHHDGTAVSAKDFYGQYLLIYFGFSYCPDICPTSLVQMIHAIQGLKPKQQQSILPVLITLDPERDTPEELAAYVADFDPRMVGLTGTPQQISDIAQKYKVYFRKNGSEEEIKNGNYLVDHSSFFYLIKPDGTFSHMFSSQIDTETLQNNLRKILP